MIPSLAADISFQSLPCLLDMSSVGSGGRNHKGPSVGQCVVDITWRPCLPLLFAHHYIVLSFSLSLSLSSLAIVHPYSTLVPQHMPICPMPVVTMGEAK